MDITRHYHNPVRPASTRARCPVCREAVYSRAGIHPQCAVKLSDPPRPRATPPGKPAPAASAQDGPGAEVVAGPPEARGRTDPT